MAQGEKAAKKAVKKKPKTAAQIERERIQREKDAAAKKHIRRIKRFVKAAEARGYVFPDSVIPKLPKKVTDDTLRRLDKIRPATLYKKAVYISPEGTKVKGTKRKSQERSEASRKGAETRRRRFIEDRNAVPGLKGEAPQEAAFALNTIEDILYVIDNREIKEVWWKHKRDPLGKYKEEDANRLRGVLEQAIAEQGREAVAARIAENAQAIGELITQALQGSGDRYRENGREAVNALVQKFAAILRGRPLTASESLELTEQGEED